MNFSAHPLTLLLQRTAAPQSSHRTRAKVSAPSIDDGGEDWQRRRRQCWSIGKRQAWRSPPAELHACHHLRQLSHACCHTQVLHYAALTTAAKTGNGGGDHTSHLTPHTSHLTPVAAPLSKLRRGAGFEWGHRREPGGHLKQSSEGGDNRRRRRASQAAEMLRGSGSTPLFGTVLRGMKVTTGGGVILHRQHPRTPKHSTKKGFHCAMR